MQVINVSFILLSFICVIGAFTLLFAKDLLIASLGLLAVLLGIAGLFFIAGAEFLAVSQIMVYAGGIIVLILFGIMITNSSKSSTPDGIWGKRVFQLLFSGMLFALFAFMSFEIWSAGDFQAIEVRHLPIRQIGISLLSHYLFPFEFSIVLLLAALVGASVVALKK
ncbi:MAG: NADH-quinone oxidoreductase subunit J [Cytophagales bacterium]|nr:NADH-quinone oxidoreductase subunit J [Cytophagales bacterium]